MSTPSYLVPAGSPLARSGVAVRAETAADDELRFALYAAARADELAQVPWPPAVLRAFLDQQFAAQSAHYAAHHADAERWIVERHGRAIGRVYVDRTGGDATAGDWRLLDIVLMPEARSDGIGAALIRNLVRAARGARAGVTLSVARDNPRAAALYRRLGFVEVASNSATHRAMRRTAR